MKDFILNSTAVFQISVFTITLYYLVISVFGLYKKKDNTEYKGDEKRFALIVAAHNEEMVVGHIVESLKNLDYSKDLYDIFVIADNCTDGTAEVARNFGAVVYERFDGEKRGKGYALEWMFSKIFEMDKKYDAIVVFDADNLASRNFLKEMNKKLQEGYKVVQGYLDSKNPHDSWISESYSIAFWTSNRLFQLSRANLGLSNQIGGTGFCVDVEILKELGWGATCLTEDLEFTCKLVLNGYKVGWAHDAVIYDEKPLTLKQSWNQRKRWMQGFTDVASRFFTKLMKKAIKDRDFVAFDCAIYTIQPFVIVAFGLAAVLTFLQNNSEHGLNIFVINYLFNPIVWIIFSMFQFLFTPFVMTLENKLSRRMFVFFTLYSFNIAIFNMAFDSTVKLVVTVAAHTAYLLVFTAVLLAVEGKQSLKIFVWYLLYGIYTLTWVPITIQGIIDKDKKEWSHTKHTRQISINEIESIDSKSVA
ncbi:glycosyl transferase family 2 [Fervidicella metallireducens AeB]|uniref:Glycosyl transferase family 2 n=1 Tax=Fervidicella metallireducens AeB TaxID=1403537 RepID=A0A017RTN8_9CLOT|nr:glycosyltransferase family 2 protein [Fervidicella metallireducens]EYE88098.1 glycosyl transferase family 2 [Fervidicella metallireducens AeB]